LVVRPPLRSL